MILRESTQGNVRILLEIRPYLQELQSPAITPAEIDALPEFMVIVVVAGGVISRANFAIFDEADGRVITPGSYRGEVQTRMASTPQRFHQGFLDRDPDVLVKPRLRGANIPNIVGTEVNLTVGESSTIQVRLDRAPTGLTAFSVQAVVAPANVARITDVTFPVGFISASHTPDPVSGPTVRIDGTDLGGSVIVGARDVLLADLQVQGLVVGEADLRLTVSQLEDGTGDNLPRRTQAGLIVVI